MSFNCLHLITNISFLRISQKQIMIHFKVSQRPNNNHFDQNENMRFSTHNAHSLWTVSLQMTKHRETPPPHITHMLPSLIHASHDPAQHTMTYNLHTQKSHIDHYRISKEATKHEMNHPHTMRLITCPIISIAGLYTKLHTLCSQ